MKLAFESEAKASVEEGPPLPTVIGWHLSTREKIDRLVSAFEETEAYAHHERELAAAMDAEQRARSAVIHYPVTTLQDMATKAGHIRFLLDEGDDCLDKYELDALLRSLSLPTKAAVKPRKVTRG